jgi:hypothetical protein
LEYTGSCAVDCVEGSATVGTYIKGVTCCKTDYCNNSTNTANTANVIKYSSKTMIILVLIFLSILKKFNY